MAAEVRPGPAPSRSGVRGILRRWLRLLKLGLIAAAAGVVACLVGREVVLWTLPDVPEPVDAATFGAMPAADNAVPAYAAPAPTDRASAHTRRHAARRRP